MQGGGIDSINIPFQGQISSLMMKYLESLIQEIHGQN